MSPPRHASWPARTTRRRTTRSRTLRNLTPGRYHAIRPRPGRNLWAGSTVGFEVSLLPRGMRFDQQVKINVVNLDGVRPLRFDPAMFDFGDLKLDQKKLKELGFAGFRIVHPLNRKDRMDEVLSCRARAISGRSARGRAMALRRAAWRSTRR